MTRRYLQLTLPDRRRLHQLIERKIPVAEIARQPVGIARRSIAN